MIDYIILAFSEGIVGWSVLGAFILIATVFALYYVTFAIYLIVASVYSGVKLIPKSYRIWREDLAAGYEVGWGGAELGVTMPDGGEPVEKKEEEHNEIEA